MKFCFPQYFESKSRFLTYTVVAKALTDAGHELSPTDDGCDAVLFSICDATEFRQLVKCRKEHPEKVLIVGGAFAFNFWACKLYADGVWVGEVYEMAECKTLENLLGSVHCYTGGARLPIASQRIDWGRVPVAQIAPKKAYYWGGNGCKNKCKFCFTSWTRPHETNSSARIAAAQQMCKKRGLHLMVASNEYENDPGASTFDMLIKDYVSVPVRANVVRCGVEFATEGSRKTNGKPMTDNDLFHALQKAEREKVSLRLFHIAGLNTLQEWEAYIEMWCSFLDAQPYNRLLNLGFNNLQYQNYTPLYRDRKQIDPAKYITHKVTRHWYDELRMHTKSVLIGAPSTFQHVCCRMGVELPQTKEQSEFWQSMMVDPNKKLTVDSAYKALFDSEVLDTPELKVNHRTGQISIVNRA